jgi:hypothetical protein
MAKRNIITCLLLASLLYVNGQSLNGEGFIENGLKNQNLDSWQIEIAKKKVRSIEDYYLILPKKLLEAELEIKNDNRKFRLDKISRVNIKSGYLIANPDAHLEMALFRDKKNNRDILAIVLGCGSPPIQYCDFGFLEFDSNEMVWSINKEVFPWAEFNSKCDELSNSKPSDQEYFLPNIILPEFGTTIHLIDAWDSDNTPLVLIKWNGQSFEM